MPLPIRLERRRRNGNHRIEPGNRGFGVCSALGTACADVECPRRPAQRPTRSSPDSSLRVKSSACAGSPDCVQLPEISRPFFFSLPSYTPPMRGTSNRTALAVQRHVAQRQNGVLIHAVHRATQLAAAGLRNRHHQMQLPAQHPGPHAFNAVRGIRGLAPATRPGKTKNQAQQQTAKRFVVRIFM